MDPIEDAEKESSLRALEVFEVRFEGEEGKKCWTGDLQPCEGSIREMLPKLGLKANGHVNVSDICESVEKEL